jgi:hypothetical protein
LLHNGCWYQPITFNHRFSILLGGIVKITEIHNCLAEAGKKTNLFQIGKGEGISIKKGGKRT